MSAANEITAGPPVKAIPPRRDRMQSKLLVAISTPALLWIAWQAIEYAGIAGHSGTVYLLEAIAGSAFFALAAFRIRAATAGAAASGGIICFDLTVLTGRPNGGSVFHSGLTPLLLLFVLTYFATRFHRDRKAGPGGKEEKHGRNSAQVVANLGLAAVAAIQWHSIFQFRGLLFGALGPSIFGAMQAPMLAALAEATADTVSSEIGQAIGGTPFLLTTLRRVAPGEDGAISAAGTLAGIAAAAVISATGMPTLGIGRAAVVHVLVAATAGLFFDSLLGATLERRGWIGNDLVNFASTCFAAALCLFMSPGGWA